MQAKPPRFSLPLALSLALLGGTAAYACTAVHAVQGGTAHQGSGVGPAADAAAGNEPSSQAQAAVNALATTPAPSDTQLRALIAADQQANGATPGTIYVSLAHLAQPGGGTADLEVYRFGVTKALNSLSISPKIALLQPLDPGKTLYRTHLADFSLTAADWQTITSMPGAQAAVYTLAGAAVVQGDWLVYAVTRPEAYDRIMRIPNFVTGGNYGLPELESELGADRSKSIYITVANSEVTFDTRVLERIPVNLPGMIGGYYWRSYDFLRSADPVSVANGLADPSILHTAAATSGNLVAGEMFFSLPNGLQGSMLSGFQRQHRLDAQAIVATDHHRTQDGLTSCVGGVPTCGYVINGESCLVCHSNGIKISTNIIAVHGTTKEQAQAIMGQDLARYTAALTAMGFTTVQGEPIGPTLARYRSLNHVSDTRAQGSEVNPVVDLTSVFGR